jgi:RsiW-degrading membrane proteinase PrsW (M82 family)
MRDLELDPLAKDRIYRQRSKDRILDSKILLTRAIAGGFTYVESVLYAYIREHK